VICRRLLHGSPAPLLIPRLFTSSATLCDPHSFPTRRSSDLSPSPSWLSTSSATASATRSTRDCHRPSSDWSPARGALGPLSPVRHELGGSPSARLVGRSGASTLPSAPASPSCRSSSRGSRCALPRPLAEATAALITESLRFILEDSLAGYALGHGRPPSRDVTRSSPVIPSPPAQASGAVPRSPCCSAVARKAHRRADDHDQPERRQQTNHQPRRIELDPP